MLDTIRLSSGTEIQANDFLVSVRHTAQDGWELREGYDGPISFKHYEQVTPGQWEDVVQYTSAELVELADMMIERWSQFIAAVRRGEIPTKDGDTVLGKVQGPAIVNPHIP